MKFKDILKYLLMLAALIILYYFIYGFIVDYLFGSNDDLNPFIYSKTDSLHLELIKNEHFIYQQIQSYEKKDFRMTFCRNYYDDIVVIYQILNNKHAVNKIDLLNSKFYGTSKSLVLIKNVFDFTNIVVFNNSLKNKKFGYVYFNNNAGSYIKDESNIFEMVNVKANKFCVYSEEKEIIYEISLDKHYLLANFKLLRIKDSNLIFARFAKIY